MDLSRFIVATGCPYARCSIFITEPLWGQFEALIPPVVDDHPLGCHRPRISDRVVFDKLIQVLVLGASYEKISDTTCSATTIQRRRDVWIAANIFADLERICLEAYDRFVGLELEDLSVDGCIVKAPCGGDIAGKSPVDRGKQGTKRSVLTEAKGIPIGCVASPANRNDSPLLRPTLEKLGQFGFHLPGHITVHLDAGYDSTKNRGLLTELGCEWQINTKSEPLQAGACWVVERTNAWHTRGFKKLLVCTEKRARVNDAFIALANAVIIIRRLVREAWHTHRWDTRPTRKP